MWDFILMQWWLTKKKTSDFRLLYYDTIFHSEKWIVKNIKKVNTILERWPDLSETYSSRIVLLEKDKEDVNFNNQPSTSSTTLEVQSN